MSEFPTLSSLAHSDAVSVVIDPIMGRCLESKKSFSAGEILWVEDAFVFGSFQDLQDSFPSYNVQLIERLLSHNSGLIGELDAIVGSLADLDSVQSEDIALCFLQLLALQQLLKEGRDQIFISSMTESLQLLSKLTGANIDKCTSDVSSFRASNPGVIPPVITDADAALALAILNTNVFELEELGGSGLFVKTAIMEHSCAPNCSFTTKGSRLYLAAIRPISEHERLSIDYGNYFCHPTQTRREGLWRSYGFRCDCVKCLGRDVARAFLCEFCSLSENVLSSVATVFPSPPLSLLPPGTEEGWMCHRCALAPSLVRSSQLQQLEQEVIASPPRTAQEVWALVNTRTLHRSHYLVFWSLKDVADALAEEAALSRSPAAYEEALKMAQVVVNLLEEVLPGAHHEKVVHHDKVGQLAVACGNAEVAAASFRKAYEASCAACGLLAPCSVELLVLATSTPRTVDDLVAHYSNKK